MPSWKAWVLRPSSLINMREEISALRGEWKNYFD